VTALRRGSSITRAASIARRGLDDVDDTAAARRVCVTWMTPSMDDGGSDADAPVTAAAAR
jgi:hypothetical protein